MGKRSGYDAIAMGFEGEGEIFWEGKEVVHEDDVVFSAGEKETVILRKLEPGDIGSVSRLVFFNQN